MKLAIISSHPIQYYAPWFCYLVRTSNISVKVFYLWDFGVTKQVDAGFQQTIRWDVPLLTGYDYEFVPNVSSNPGTHHFWGLQNPTLLQQVGAYEPDAVMLLSYNYASIYRFLWQWQCKQAPLIFRGDSHRLVLGPGLKEWVRQRFISLVYQRFSTFLYVGAANYSYFRCHDVLPENLFFAPHAVNNEWFFTHAEPARQQAAAWKQDLGIPQNYTVVLFAGKFEAKKRPLDLLQAFVEAHLPQTALLFVGSGSLESELKAKATGYSHIYFAPFQNQTLMPRTYAAADLVVLPSYGNDETWGLAINEAMCMARPVIVSTHVGCAQDLVQPSKNGLVFAAGDVPALTACLQEAFSDRERLKEWGEVGRKVVANYSYAQATQGLEEALVHLNVLALENRNYTSVPQPSVSQRVRRRTVASLFGKLERLKHGR